MFVAKWTLAAASLLQGNEFELLATSTRVYLFAFVGAFVSMWNIQCIFKPSGSCRYVG